MTIWLQLLAFIVWAGHARAQDVTTWHYDNSRSGVQPNETQLTPANVNASQFGKVFRFSVIGDVYAQPLYLGQYTMGDGYRHNVLVVATAEDNVYAFDADGNNPPQGYLWSESLLGPGETWVTASDVNTTDINPNIGIIGTPVIDRTRGTIYVVAKSKTTNGSTVYYQRLHALNIADGKEELNGPTQIEATVPGTADNGMTITFDPLLQNQRAALLLAPTPGVGSGNSVIIAWASHGDNGAFHGWIIAYDAADISHQNAAWADTPNGTEGGIWNSGGGLSSDGAGNIFAAISNGEFDASTGGSDYGDSAVRLTLSPSAVNVADSFTPADQASLEQGDHDFGISALALLPAQPGSLPHVAVTADKSGTIFLLNRDDLGGYDPDHDTSVQSLSDGGHRIHSNVAFFNGRLYLGLDNGPLQSWKFDPSTDQLTADFATSTIFQTANSGLGYSGGGGTPSISANGTDDGIAWILGTSQYNYGPAVLHAYDAGDLTQELYNSSQAANSRDKTAIAVKFTTPTIANGRVYVGGRNAVTVYGPLTSGACSAPSSDGVNVCSPVDGATVTSPVQINAAATVTGGVYRFELWSGSTKLLSEDSGVMNQAISLAPGSYKLSFDARNSSGTHVYTTRNITVSGNACSPPSSDGVNVCSPDDGATVASPVQIDAAATVTGGVYRFELWSGSTKLLSEDGGVMNQAISLAPGSYKLSFDARNNSGTHVYATRNITVSGSTCSPPSSDGVNVCSPANGASVTSPVQIDAAATVTGGVYRFELWSGSTKLLSEDGGVMNQAVSLAPGSYKLSFDARNSSGTHVYATSNITVSGSSGTAGAASSVQPPH